MWQTSIVIGLEGFEGTQVFPIEVPTLLEALTTGWIFDHHQWWGSRFFRFDSCCFQGKVGVGSHER